MNIKRFLERINFQQPIEINLATLNALQTAFVTTVPFENLVIHFGDGINYEPEAVFNKIVERGQGGVCYESNSLFYDALLVMGFDAQLIAAQMYPDQMESWMYSHMTILVTLEEQKYVVDVSNGMNFGAAVPVDDSGHTFAEGLEFKIAPYNDAHLGLFYLDDHSVEENAEPQWQARYAFNLEPKTRASFKDVCEFIQFSPDSIFVQKRLATLPKGKGRITLSDNKLIDKSSGDKTVELEVTAEEYQQLLKGEFGLNYKPSDFCPLSV